MADLWVGEYGKTLYIETGFNMSSATGIQIHFSAPSGGIHFINSASVSVLASNVTTSACGVFSANKTLEYIINAGDFSGSTSAGAAAGTWKGWIQADFGGAKRLISSTFKFEVDMPG
jgi:hypothetical protein